MSATTAPNDFVVAPFTILRDSNEQSPWTFRGFKTDGGKSLVVPVDWHSLGDRQGDYTIAGATPVHIPPGGPRWRISIERKSLPDLFQTIIAHRKRFERELIVLNHMERACVIVEGELSDAMSFTGEHWEAAGLTAAQYDGRRRRVLGSVVEFQQNYPVVHWWFCPGKQSAEACCYRVLERWWKKSSETHKESEKPQ